MAGRSKFAALLLILTAFVAPADSLRPQPDSLRHWLHGLVIPLPVGMTSDLPMGMGNLTLTGGSCWGLEIGHLITEDNSDDLTLEFAVNTTNVDISCHVEGITGDNEDLTIDVIMNPSEVDVAFQIEPTTNEFAPQYDLPLGNLTMTSCVARLFVGNISFSGTSQIVTITGYYPPGMIEPVIGPVIDNMLCEGLMDVIEEKGNPSLELASKLVGAALFPPWQFDELETVKPTLDWNEYPPIKVVQALIGERFYLWEHRILEILQINKFDRVIYESENITFSLKDIDVQGRATDHNMGVVINANGSRIGADVSLEGLTMRLAFELKLHWEGQPELIEELHLNLGLHNMSMGVMAYVDQERLDALEVDKAIHSPKCLVDCSADLVDPDDQAISVDKMAVSMKPLLSVSAPGSLETDITHFANNVVSSLYAGYMPTVNALVNGGLGIARSPLNTLMWKKIDELAPCQETEQMLGVNQDVVDSFWIVALVISCFAVFLGAAWHYHVARRARVARAVEVREASASDANPGSDGHAVDPNEGEMMREVSLCQQPLVPRYLAVLYPIVIVAVAFLFLYADFGLGATVTVLMKSGEKESELGPIFSFSLMNTIVHAWEAESYFISVLTLLLSGIWPFVKLTMLLVAWLAPPQKLSVRRRGSILKFLDTWGKYSFVDSWFLVLSMSAFALTWSSVGETENALMVRTTPRSAFYAFFLATACSLILGHVASQYHTSLLAKDLAAQRVLEKAAKKAAGTDDVAEEADKKIALRSMIQNKKLRQGMNWALGATIVLTLFGIFFMSFEFHISGIFTEFLFGSTIEKSYSLWSVGAAVAEGRYDEFGLIVLELVFLVLAVFLPMMMLSALAALWNMPMAAKDQERLLRFCYFLESWTSLDVAVLVLIVAVFEFARLSEFLVYRSNFAAPCTMVKDITRSECLAVELTGLGPMLFLLLAGAFNVVVPKVIMHLSAAATARRVGGPALPGSEKASDLKPCTPKSYQGVHTFFSKEVADATEANTSPKVKQTDAADAAEGGEAANESTI